MKKTYKLKNLDCANCAAKMEAQIKKLNGVEDATVSFITQKLTIVAEESMIPEIAKEAAKICRKIEPDCEVIL